MQNIGRSRLLDIFQPREIDYWWVKKIKELSNKYIIEKFDLENYRSDKLFKIISESLRNYGYFSNSAFIFIFSLIPAFWILALMVCRITRWTSLYAILLVGNFLKNYFFAYIYELIGFWGVLSLILTLLVIVSFVVKKIAVNLSKKS